MSAGLIALLLAVVAASAAGFALRRRNGRLRALSGTGQGDSRSARLTPAELGAPLGERATLVQFSTELCAYCGPTRELLGEVAARQPGVALIEIDAAERMDLSSSLNIFATPTVFVLDPDGSVVRRASGQPRKADVLEAVGSVLDNLGTGEGDSSAAGE